MPTSVDAPLISKGAPLARTGPAGPNPPVYNLYTKINAFWTHNNRIVQKDFFVLRFSSYTEFVSFYLCICTKYVSLCAQHSSRPFAERSLRKLFSPPLFYSFFFGTIFEMHSQLFSANLFTLASAELQDPVGWSPGETRVRLPHYQPVVKLPRSMSECYSSFFTLSLSPSLLLFFGFFLFFVLWVLFSRWSESPRAGRKGTSHRDRDRSLPARPRTRYK